MLIWLKTLFKIINVPINFVSPISHAPYEIMNRLILETKIENSEFYISSLAIGILEGMKSGTVSLEIGIWSLARPIFWQVLREENIVSKQLIDCICQFDELDVMSALDINVAKALEDLLMVLRNCQKNSLNQSPSLAIASSVVAD